MHVIDLEGNEYALQATTTNDYELNGNQSISFSILPSKVNKLFIDNITEMWKVVDHDDITHKIVYLKKRGTGDSLSVEVKAAPLIFDDLDSQRIYERYDRSMTANYCFNLIFNGSGYNFTLNGTFESQEWEGFGEGDTRLTLFKKALERYKAEFRVSGNIVYIENRIGRDTQFMYRYRLNASNIVQENDATAYWTYAKGYGDYGDGEGGEDWQNAKLKREYTSPLAKIIGIRHAPPIKNGNITTRAQMDAQLKTLVDESLKISITADIHDLTRQNYPIAQSQLGDRVFIIDERIGLDEEVRVVNKTITRNWRGDILDVTLTFGSEGLAKRHQSNLNTALKNVTDWLTGKKTIPYTIVDEAIKNATQALKNAQTELKFANGILAIDKQDPNKVVLFNSAGVGISSDGGNTFRTAMTGDGMVADVIYAGTLNANRVAIVGGDAFDYTTIQGSTLESRGRFTRTWRGKTATHDNRTVLQNGYVRLRNDTEDWSLYVMDSAISTFADGDGGGLSSGTIEFRDTQFSTARGLTVHSNYGVVALQSENNRVILDAYQTANIESSQASVYLRPFRNSRPGNNVFQFYVKDNASVAETDGVIYYGSDKNDVGSGLRLSKRSRSGEIHATDHTGDKSSGTFHAQGFYGELRPHGTYNYIRAERTRFVAPGTSTSTYSTIQFKDGMSESIRTTATNFYIGTSTGEVRITNNLLYNGGDIGYRPIRAKEFITDTSVRENKRSIEVYDLDVLEIIRKADAYLYNRKNEGAYTKKQLGLMLDEMPYETYSERGDGFGIYGLVTFLFRGLKQAIEEIDKLKEGA